MGRKRGPGSGWGRLANLSRVEKTGSRKREPSERLSLARESLEGLCAAGGLKLGAVKVIWLLANTIWGPRRSIKGAGEPVSQEGRGNWIHRR